MSQFDLEEIPPIPRRAALSRPVHAFCSTSHFACPCIEREKERYHAALERIAHARHAHEARRLAKEALGGDQ